MSTPAKSETPLAGGVTQRKNEKTDGQIVADDARFVALQNMLASKGHELHRLRDGTYLASRWGLSRELRTLADVEVFLRLIGVQHEL